MHLLVEGLLCVGCQVTVVNTRDKTADFMELIFFRGCGREKDDYEKLGLAPGVII